MTKILPRDRSSVRCHWLFVELSSHPAETVQAGIESVFSINSANIVHPTLVIPSDPSPHNSLAFLYTSNELSEGEINNNKEVKDMYWQNYNSLKEITEDTNK